MKLCSLIGLKKEKRKARIAIAACKRSGEVFPHTLLTAIGGVGKTLFARSIGYELGYHFVETHAAAFKVRESLFSAIISHSDKAKSLRKTLMLFLDEVHGLKIGLQEALYSVMKEWWIPIAEGKRFIEPFTLIAATTRSDMLDANSFVTRFPNVWEIERYDLEEMMQIIAFEFDKHGLRYSIDVLRDIGRRCLGIPRIAVNLVGKVRLMVLSEGRSEVTLEDTKRTFELEGIDRVGLHSIHLRYLRVLGGSRSSGRFMPMGIGSISGKMRQSRDLIEGGVEPILLELNLVSATPRGRILTEAGSRYLENF